mgnify:CR=1 FL=1
MTESGRTPATYTSLTEIPDFQGCVELAPLGIFVADYHLNFTYVNKAACELTGYTQNELLSMDVGAFITPEWSHDAESGRREILERGMLSGNVPYYTKDGSKRYWSVHAVKLNAEEIICYALDITEMVNKEHELAALAEKKRQLLIEMNHRVKNNLANVEALAMLELGHETKNKSEAIEDIINRIRTIGYVHQQLYSGESSSVIELSSYLTMLVEKLVRTYSKPDIQYKPKLSIRPERLCTKTCTTLGLITTELLTNTFKHADCRGSCTISIQFSKHLDTYQFNYRDSGQYLPPRIRSVEDLVPGTGLLLIQELVAGLNGTILLDRSDGTAFSIEFPAV